MITRLSTMTNKQRETYMKYYDTILLSGLAGFKVLPPEKEFDACGLRFPINYLNELDKNVVFFPLEIMAEYVDIITKLGIDANVKDFINQIYAWNFDLEKTYENTNATAIGNLAYIVLNCTDEKVKNICEKHLNAIFVKAKGKLLNAFGIFQSDKKTLLVNGLTLTAQSLDGDTIEMSISEISIIYPWDDVFYYVKGNTSNAPVNCRLSSLAVILP